MLDESKPRPSVDVGRSRLVCPGLFLWVFLIAGCVDKTVHREPMLTFSLAHHYSRQGREALPQQWWLAFQDPDLNRLVARALNDNQDLQSAWRRLDQVAALNQQTRASLFPNLDAQLSDTRRDGSNDMPGASGRILQLGLAATYEVDLWGRLRAERAMSVYQLHKSEEDLQTTALVVAAEVTDAWLLIARQRAVLSLLERQLAKSRQQLALIERRFQLGLTPLVDVFRQRRQVEAVAGELPDAKRVLALQQQRLAILLGRPPWEPIDVSRHVLPKTPPFPKTGLPLDLLLTRPDLRAAHFSVLEADEQVAIAVADQFPTLRLSANLTSNADSLRDLFDDWLSTVVADLLTPVFDGGRLKAEVERTRARYAELIHIYRQSYLTALGEVEQAMTSELQQKTLAAALATQLHLAEQEVRETRRRFHRGNTNYLDVLDAVQDQQALERSLIEARWQLLVYRVSLYRALGGHWDMTRDSSKRVEE